MEEADEELDGGAGGEGDGAAGGGDLDCAQADELGIEGRDFGVGLEEDGCADLGGEEFAGSGGGGCRLWGVALLTVRTCGRIG